MNIHPYLPVRRLAVTVVFLSQCLYVPVLWSADAKATDAKAPAKGEGKDTAAEVTTIKRQMADPKKDEKKPDGKDAKKAEKKGPAKPEQRRNRERSSVEDIDDELSILKELLDIERGSDTEADTLLELSYVLWDRAEAYDIEAYDQKFEVGISEAEKAGEKVEARRLKVEQQNLLELGRAAKLDVVNHLKRIERAFPQFVKLDEVLYSLGYHLNEMERPGEAVDAYMRLVRKRPKSNFLPDAFLGIGNYYFAKNQGGEALKWYTKVTEFPDSSIYGWGLYYIAWVHYNQQQWAQAIKGFIRVLDYSKNEAHGRVQFLEDASRYLVRSWAETGKPKEALAFFKNVAPGTEILLLDNLSAYYVEISQFEKSNAVLDDLIDYAKDHANFVRYVTLRLENSYKLHDLAETVKSAQMLTNALRQNPDRKAANLEVLLAEIASTLHAEYERTLVVSVLEAAEKVYRNYGEHFEQGEHGYDMLHNHALALFELAELSCKDSEKQGKATEKGAASRDLCYQRYNDSAAAYERVIALSAKGKYAESAAHRAFIAYYRTQNVSQETGTKDQDNILRPIPLKPEEERVAAACTRYVDIALRNNAQEDVPEALFVGGRLWYQHNYFDKAGDMLAKFVERFQGHALAVTAARLMLSSFALAQDGKNLISWTNKLINDTRFTQGSPEADKLNLTLVAIKSNEEYNKCLELKDDPVKAAECLKSYAVNFPDNREQAARAVVGAAEFYRRAKRRDDVITMYQELSRKYPEDKRAAQASFEVADIYRQSGDFDAATVAYEEFVQRYPNDPLVPRALKTATAINRSLARWDKVVHTGELFLELCNKATSQEAKDACTPEARARVSYDITTPEKEKGDWKAVIKASDRFLKRADALPVHLRLAAMTNTGSAQSVLKLGDRGRKLFDDVLKEAKVIADSGKLGELDPIGRDAIAEALFMTGEIEFAKMQAIKGKPKDLKAAVDLAAQKAKAAAVAEGFYGEIENSKNPRWTAAAASRRGRLQQEIAISIKTLPAPPALSKSEELKAEWATQLAEKGRPYEEKAVELYRSALDAAAAIYAFDKYWAEARDNLKVLDTKFAERADVKEFTVEMTDIKWGESEKPQTVIAALRLELFNLNNAQPTAAVEGAETQVTHPELAKSWTRMALAHYALEQYREAVVAAVAGMGAAEELKNSGVLWNMMGLAYSKLGETQKALQAFDKAGQVDSKSVDALLNAASITVRNLGFAKTVEVLDEVLKREPDNYWAKVTRPVAVRRASDDPEKTKEALAALDALAAKSDRPEGHYNRCVIGQATLTANKAEMTKALDYCETALKAATEKKSALAKELQKRVKGLQDAISFMPN